MILKIKDPQDKKEYLLEPGEWIWSEHHQCFYAKTPASNCVLEIKRWENKLFDSHTQECIGEILC